MNIDADFDSAFFETKYGKLHYKHHDGNTTPIVFLHGLAASVKSWTRLVEFLPDSLDIYLVDLIGHGMSEAPKIEYTLKMQYEILCDFIKRAVGRPTVLFGHSYGGWLAAYYAAYNDAEGLVLESPSGLREFMENRKIYNTGYIEHMVKRALTLNPREYVLRSTLNADNSGMLLDAGVLSMIKCKCLIVWGSGDDL
ncbi:MAG: alpha/beta fold hydrolase, partial [Candidatus Micrarchaeota archaeon]|nr:alpha/beta fold hydrolase [Candidatus Micrarchaeota archaeon]